MSDYFWSAVNYIYDHRLTPAEGAGACASGATVGSPGGSAGAGAGCAVSVISDIISKLFNGSGPVIREPIGTTPFGTFSDCEASNSCPDTHCPYYEGSDYCPAPENKPCSDLGNDSCPVINFGGFGTNSNDFPTVSSGWV